MKQLITILLLLLFELPLFAQTTVKGKITDCTTGEPLIGASVYAMGTAVGTISDIDGTFELTVPDSVKFIGISYMQSPGPDKVPVAEYIHHSIGNCDEIDADSIAQLLSGVLGCGFVHSPIIVFKNNFSVNKVNTFYPLQSIQGKHPNLLITRPGGDPNEDFRVRIRGLSTFGAANSEPLSVVDGIPNVHLNLLDPNDIESVRIYKNPFDAATYGIQGGSGVMEFSTSKWQSKDLELIYRSEFSINRVARTVPVANRTAYLQTPRPIDFGEETDWQSEISQPAPAQMHHLTLNGQMDQTAYQMSATYRNTSGVLRNTGFERLNLAAQLEQKALKNKLTLTAAHRTAMKDAQLGFPQAFGYAIAHNPTAPILDENSTDFGGYFTQFLFDYQNPVALIEQNINEQTMNQSLTSLKAKWDWTSRLSSTFTYGLENRRVNQQSYFSKNSLFIGSYRNGLARIIRDEKQNQFFQGKTTLDTYISTLQFRLSAGYDFQELNYNGRSIEAGDFISDAFSFNNIAAAQDIPNGLSSINSYQNKQRLIAFWSMLDLDYQAFTLRTKFRREGASHLGIQNKWDNFGGVSLNIDLNDLIFLPNLVDLMLVNIGWGKAGNIPLRNGLSTPQVIPADQYYQNGTYQPYYVIRGAANPNLGAENTSGWHFNWKSYLWNGRLDIDLTYFNTQSSNLLFEKTTSDNQPIWDNSVVIKQHGFEAQFNFEWVRQEDFAWASNMVWGTARSTVDEKTRAGGENYFPFPSPGCCSGLARLELGEEVGQIIAPEYITVVDGEVQFRDANRDGSISRDDYIPVGNALPDWTMGWENIFRWKQLEIEFFLRGAFGHQIVNSARLFYENSSITSVYNVVQTKYYDPTITDAPRYSSLHVENASFLRLDYLTLGYLFELKSSRNLRLYINTQNLFALTGYTGTDPEVRVGEDRRFGVSINGQSYPNVLVAGIDDRATYFPIKSFTFGVQLEL